MRVVIVGAGLAGCSVAYHLGEDAETVLLEQAEQPGAEASSQNAGMVRRMGEDPWERALALRTAAWLADCDWEGASTVTGAVLGLVRDQHALHDAAAHLRSAGVEVQDCDRPAEVAPVLEGTPLRQAWYLPAERVADAHVLVSGFLRASAASLRRGVRVTGLRVQGGRMTGVDTADGPVDADRVVLAAGAWSAALAATAGLERPLIPIRRTLLQTRPHPLSAPGHPWTWLDDVGVYVRPEAGGWLTSPCDEAVDPPGEGPGSRGPVEPLHRALAADKIERYLPALGEVAWQGGWTGLRTFAPDRRPVLGADPDLQGLWWAAGLGGFGVTCSAAVGEVVATWLRGGELDWITPEGVGPGRPLPRRWLIRPDGDTHHAKLVSGRC